ncbi:uncharacterized protein EDB91DRAFT_1334606 [Suillus paluster]|uniref:uncharacterized protein n=1 Tax=Suillus paluster TaxID=48578 RepID=UPI001B860096|nr:uncharacterized protein EDB91DRAFT_1334606 [Suillus paluster]KAG1748372.1 hypothetical protein EDB91DRAFT_1334606 [Suillus paluster]
MERETSGLRGRVEDKPICHLKILRDNRLLNTLPGRAIAPSRTPTQSKILTDTMKIQFTYLAILAAAAGVKAAPSNTDSIKCKPTCYPTEASCTGDWTPFYIDEDRCYECCILVLKIIHVWMLNLGAIGLAVIGRSLYPNGRPEMKAAILIGCATIEPPKNTPDSALCDKILGDERQEDVVVVYRDQVDGNGNRD